MIRVLAIMLMMLAMTMPARAQDLIFDLSDHLIAITTAFTGTEVVGFGALGTPGDVVITVTGPSDYLTVRRAEPTAGVWINRESVTFTDAPTFYSLASSRPIEDFVSPATAERHGIGLENLRFRPIDADGLPQETVEQFRDGLVRRMQDEGLYYIEPAHVAFLGDRLFRTTITFPANVPTGQYNVTARVIRDGHEVSAQTTPLVVSKTGLGFNIYRFATVYSAEYGIMAIVLAVFTGWLASLVFRRR